MIYGIGTDILNSQRIKKIIDEFGNKFVNRFFGDEEIEFSKKTINRTLFYSKRFSAKESFWKALSPEYGSICFREIQILSGKNRKPIIKLDGKTKNFILEKENKLKKKFNFHVSLSDEPPNVLSFVIIFLAPLD